MPDDPTVPPAELRGERVLVTGAGGFLGGNIVCCLQEHGFRVRALVRRPPRGPHWAALGDVEFVRGDIRDCQPWRHAIDGVAAVIHTAGLTQLVPRPRRLAYQVNVDGTRRICEAARSAGVRRLVFTSSIASVKPSSTSAAFPADEGTPTRPHGLAPYHASKWHADRVVANFSRQGLETITLCPAYILGPRDFRPTTNQILLVAACSPVLMLPPGGINVIDVRETALAHVRALWLGEPGRRYFVAGPYCTYVELSNLARRLVGRRCQTWPSPHWTRWPYALAFAVLSGVLPQVPNALSLPNLYYGYESFHVTGERAGRTFHLKHRPIRATVHDTLQWFHDIGLTPWLPAPHARP